MKIFKKYFFEGYRYVQIETKANLMKMFINCQWNIHSGVLLYYVRSDKFIFK